MAAPDWADENDPGVTLVQVKAWLAAALVAWRLVDWLWPTVADALRHVARGSNEADFTPLRRILLFIEEAVERALRFAEFEPDGDARRWIRPSRRRP